MLLDLRKFDMFHVCQAVSCVSWCVMMCTAVHVYRVTMCHLCPGDTVVGQESRCVPGPCQA